MITEVHTPTEGSFSGQKHLRMLTLVAADIDNHPVDQYGNRYMVHINCSFLVFYWLRSAYSGKEISNQSDTGVVILFDGSPKKKTSGYINLDFKCKELQVTSKDFTCTKYIFYQSVYLQPLLYSLTQVPV